MVDVLRSNLNFDLSLLRLKFQELQEMFFKDFPQGKKYEIVRNLQISMIRRMGRVHAQ